MTNLRKKDLREIIYLTQGMETPFSRVHLNYRPLMVVDEDNPHYDQDEVVALKETRQHLAFKGLDASLTL